MKLPLAACLALAALPCCTQDATAVHWPQEAWLLHDDAGVAVAVPSTWVTSRGASGVLAGGAEGAPDYFFSVAIQAIRPPPKARMEQVLDAAYAHPSVGYNMPPVTTPCIAGDALGLCYSVSFAVFDEPRRRVGVLIDLAPYVVDVSMVGPAAELEEHLEVFERAFMSLYIEPAG